MNKRTNDDLQNFLQKTKDRATRTPQKTASERGYIGRVAHGYIGRVAHGYIWRVAHGYIWRVAHGYIGRVAHGYIGRVASKMMRIISNSVFLLLPRGHEMGISAYYKHNFFGRRYKFESNQCGFGFSSNKWTDGRRRYVLLKRQSQIQLQWKFQFEYNNKWKSTKLFMVKRSSIKCMILLRTEFSNTAELLSVKSE
jgi:hypothetical protein